MMASLRPMLTLALLALTACGADLSPEARCFADATVAYRGAWRGAEKIRADLARGYALHEREIKVAQAVTCRVAGRLDTCLGNARERITIPVAIDRAALKARLAALETRMDTLRPTATEAAAPCGYGNRVTP